MKIINLIFFISCEDANEKKYETLDEWERNESPINKVYEKKTTKNMNMRKRMNIVGDSYNDN